jgi:ribosomal protein L7Ae-like RNA K-turn-binding protein
MAIKDIKEAIEKKNVIFGLRETLKASKGKKKLNVLVVSDAREETLKKLKEKGIEFETLKKKDDVTKDLNLNFRCGVFLIK